MYIQRLIDFLAGLYWRLFGVRDQPDLTEEDDMAKKKKKTKGKARSAVSGKYVSKDFAASHPKTTVNEKK